MPSCVSFAVQVSLEIPLLEATLRAWAVPSTSAADDQAARRRTREAVRLLQLLSAVREAGTQDAAQVVAPFIEVVKSGPTLTQAKSTAVECLHRLVGALGPTDVEAPAAVALVAEAVMECRFEQTDTAADEVAIMWLLEALSACVHSRAGRLLSDEVVFRICETMFDASVAPFHLDTLKSQALRLSGDLVRLIFAQAEFGSDAASTTTTSRGAGVVCAERVFRFFIDMADPEKRAATANSRLVALKLLVEATAVVAEPDSLRFLKDAGIADMVKDDLMRIIVQTAQSASRLSPSPSSSASGGAGSALTAGANGDDATAAQQQQQQQLLPRYHILVVGEALRLANLFYSRRWARENLKAQFECFFNAVVARLMAQKASRPDEAILVVQLMCELMKDPLLLVDVFVSYDCSLQSTDVFENLFKYVSRLAFPSQLSSPPIDQFQMLALHGLLLGVRAMETRPDVGNAEAEANVDAARRLKLRKAALVRCAEAFNEKPKHGLAALINEGILREPPDPLVMASFLRNTPYLDKQAVGVFLGDEDALNRAVLRAYTETFDVRNRPLLASLRMFLECFRLPKEAQQIDRILQAFADVAFADCADSAYFPSVDACYIFCFAVIMLNTDLHNPNIRPEKRMTLEQFLQHNRNYGEEVSKGVDLPMPWLTGIYEQIKAREINTMREGSALTAEVSKDRWTDLLLRQRDSTFSHHDQAAASAYDRVMFERIWAPTLAAVSVVFDSGQPGEQPEPLHIALEGFLALAKVAAKYGMYHAFDSVMASICKFTSLLVYGPVQSEESVAEDGARLVASVRAFGNHHKAQMATMCVFAVARRFGNSMRKSWRHVLWCLLRLSDLRLLPNELTLEDVDIEPVARALFHKKTRDVVLKHAEDRLRLRRQKSQQEAGWLSGWLFGGASSGGAAGSGDDGGGGGEGEQDRVDEYRSLLSALHVADACASVAPAGGAAGAGEAGKPASDSQAFVYARDTVKSCRVHSIVSESKSLKDPALLALVGGLLHALGVGPAPAADDDEAETEAVDLGMELLAPPSAGGRVFCVHLLTEIVLWNADRMAVLWPAVQSGLLEVIRDAPRPSFRVELACVGMCRVFTKVFNRPDCAESLVVCLQELVADSHALAVAPGFDSLVGKVVLDAVRALPKGQVPACGWAELFGLLSSCAAASPQSAAPAFEALKAVAVWAPVVDVARVARAFSETQWAVGDAPAHEAAACDVLFEAHERALASSDIRGVWFPVLRELALLGQSDRVLASSRRRALSLLLRAVVDERALLPSDALVDVVETIVFPTCNFVLSAGEGRKPARPGESLAMVAAAELMSKTMIMYASTLAKSPALERVLVTVVDFLARFKQAGVERLTMGDADGGLLAQTAQELVKNLVLGLAAEKVLGVRLEASTGAVVAVAEHDMAAGSGYGKDAARLWGVVKDVIDAGPLRDGFFPNAAPLLVAAAPAVAASNGQTATANAASTEETLPPHAEQKTAATS